MLIVTLKYHWQTIFVPTLVNFPKKSQLGNEQKNRNVEHANSETQKVILAHRVCKVRETRGT